MTAPLGTSVSSTQYKSSHQTKNVDKPSPTLGISAAQFNALGHIGTGNARKIILESLIERQKPGFVFTANPPTAPKLSDEELYALEIASFVEEEAEEAASTYKSIVNYIPDVFQPFLMRMSETRREERVQAILSKIGWKTLKQLNLDSILLSSEADSAAWKYSQKYPKDDERYQSPEHRKERNAKTWRRRYSKNIRKARSYVAAALGAIGGSNTDSRPLYVADYAISCRRDEQRQSRKILEKLRIVNVSNPSIQIPMLEASERKKIKEMAKRRLLLDVLEVRAEMTTAKAVWITITLPGHYHPNPTNLDINDNNWDPKLGPEEAMKEIQDRYHQTMCMLRERGVRAWGFWDAQAQQDGTPHRHIIIFINDDDERKALKNARSVAQAFRNRFPGNYGCDASVIGDDHPNFKPRNDKLGKEETVSSIIRYTARYATRMSSTDDGNTELAGSIPDAEIAASELERHAAWASERHARLHTLIGLDSQRAPNKIWDCIWKAAERGEAPTDARMSAAVEFMSWTQNFLNDLIDRRIEFKKYKTENQTDLEYEEHVASELKKLQKAVSETAYHAALMCGMWSDADLHHAEKAWMRDHLDIKENEDIPLAPIPLRAERENCFGEMIKETIGIAAPIIKRQGTVDEPKPDDTEKGENDLILTMSDGSWKLVRPSDDTTKQIILRVEDWVIVDVEKAKEMTEEALKINKEKNIKDQEKEDEEQALRKAFRESEIAQSPINEIDEGINSIDFIDNNMKLSDIPIYPSYGTTFRTGGIWTSLEAPPE